jgi:hypothetical protein
MEFELRIRGDITGPRKLARLMRAIRLLQATEGDEEEPEDQEENAADAGDGTEVAQRVARLWPRCSAPIHDMLKRAAETFEAGQPWTMEDLAAATGQDVDKLRSYHRILARPLKRIPGPPIIEKVSGSGANSPSSHYVFDAAAKAAILAQP